MLNDITLYEFNSLMEHEQIEALGEYGELVSHKFEDNCKFILYQVNDFYVEIKYITEGNVFINLTAFKTTDRLDAYLKEINIENLKKDL